MKRNADLIFIGLLFAVSFLYGYHAILFARPTYHHIWRQSDCLSITKNYYEDNRNFFRPAINWVGDKGGRTVSEFPIIYFSVAQLWKIFGYHEFIFRLIDVLLVFTGLFSLFRLARELLSDTFWAAIIPLFLFSSPILGYFTNNFLADAPALGLTLTGCYFYWKAFAKQSNKWYLLSFLIFLLAGLLKISSLVIFIALFIIQVYRIIFRGREKAWHTSFSRLWPFLLVLLGILAWYSYAGNYNSHNLNGIFLHGILPIWGIDAAARSEIWKSVVKTLLPGFFTIPALIFDLAAFVSLFLFYKKINRFFLFLSLLVFIGCIGFFLLFYQVFNVHDYYLTNMLIFIPLPLITLLDLLHRKYPVVFNNKFLKIGAALCLVALLYIGAVNTRMRYFPRQAFVQKSIFVNKENISSWIQWSDYCGTYFKAFETITPYLRSLGIKRDDLVYSTPDGTINVTLYLMDQKGFSDFYIGGISEDQRIETVKSYGVKYLIINDSVLYRKPFLAPYLLHKIGTYQNVDIFDISH
ncbi:MAG: glycosyltransferase family 39 protein [Bacteroidetes bacterium]|nr:glycosyltransferase family 39 protein [Bacteroidota bacterium]